MTLACQNGRAFGFQGTKSEWPHPGMHKPGMISGNQVSYRAAMAANGTVVMDADSATIECPADPVNHLPAYAPASFVLEVE